MVGFKETPVLSRGQIEERMGWEKVGRDLKRVNVPDSPELLRRFLMGPREVAVLVKDGFVNTDDTNLIEFSTPKTLFADTEELNARVLEPFKRSAREYFGP
jgi:hypothetical protein